MKGKIIAIILIVLLFTPTVVAIVNYSQQLSSPVNASNIVLLSVTDLNGKARTYSRDSSESDKEVINKFLKINQDATLILELPSTLKESTEYMDVLFTSSSNKSDEYKYYFDASNSDNAYYESVSDGSCYKISSSDAEEIMNSTLGQSLYMDFIPQVKLSNGDYLSPTTADWNYYNSSLKTTGNSVQDCYMKADMSIYINAEVQTFELPDKLVLSFDNDPDTLSLKITDSSSGEVLYDNISYADFTSQAVVLPDKANVVVTAEWLEDEDRNYYGTLSFVLDATFPDAAAYFFGETSGLVQNEVAVEQGDFVTITGINISDAASVTFSSEPSIDFTPTFFSVEDKDKYAIALIPLKSNLSAGTYVFTLGYNGESQQLTVNVSEKTFGGSDSAAGQASADKVIEYYTSDNFSSFNSQISDAVSSGSSTKYFDDSDWLNFYSYTTDTSYNGGYMKNIQLASAVSIDGETITSYQNPGVDYGIDVSSEVKAVNAGIVVFSGHTDLWGNIVIIEHGYGLKSWYMNLQDPSSLAVGTVVSKGDAVGMSGVGTSNYSNGDGVHIRLTINDAPVNIYPLWSDGTWGKVPIYG